MQLPSLLPSRPPFSLLRFVRSLFCHRAVSPCIKCPPDVAFGPSPSVRSSHVGYPLAPPVLICRPGARARSSSRRSVIRTSTATHELLHSTRGCALKLDLTSKTFDAIARMHLGSTVPRICAACWLASVECTLSVSGSLRVVVWRGFRSRRVMTILGWFAPNFKISAATTTPPADQQVRAGRASATASLAGCVSLDLHVCVGVRSLWRESVWLARRGC